jgi:hypothetical protein
LRGICPTLQLALIACITVLKPVGQTLMDYFSEEQLSLLKLLDQIYLTQLHLYYLPSQHIKHVKLASGIDLKQRLD